MDQQRCSHFRQNCIARRTVRYDNNEIFHDQSIHPPWLSEIVSPSARFSSTPGSNHQKSAFFYIKNIIILESGNFWCYRYTNSVTVYHVTMYTKFKFKSKNQNCGLKKIISSKKTATFFHALFEWCQSE